MIEEGRKKRMEKIANPKGNRVVGVFRGMEAGYGFVRPTGTKRAEGRLLDIYIPTHHSGDASTGDVVMVQLGSRHSDRQPGPRGQIVEVLERESHEFVGTYFESAGGGDVEVD